MAMADPPSKVRWDKENVKVITFKLFRKTDTDIIEYLTNRDKPKTVRAALREYMKNHPDGEN